MKICIKCNESKPPEEFYKGGTAKDGRFTECKVCNRERARNSMRALREADPHYSTRRQLKHRYGITLERYEEILLAQGGGCGICGATEPGGRGSRFHVDHDHACCPQQGATCGKCVRALLCHGCNTGIGNFGDDPDRLLAAAAYLLARADVLGEATF